MQETDIRLAAANPAHTGRRRVASLAVGVVALALQGCTCGPAAGEPDDAGSLFAGLDAADYAPSDTGPRASEPCSVPSRRVAFPLGEGAASGRSPGTVWASGSRAWVYLSSEFRDSPPPELRLFDLDAERELAHEVPISEGDTVLGVFDVSGAFEVVLSRDGAARVAHFDRDGQRAGPSEEPLPLTVLPRVRLEDGRFVGLSPVETDAPEEVSIELAAPSGTTERIPLGFRTSSSHVATLHWNGAVLRGLGIAGGGSRLVRYEVDLVSSSVRLTTLLDSVRVGGTNGRGLAIWADGDATTAAVVHQPADAEPTAPWDVELFWWSVGGEATTREVVRPASELGVAIYALGGALPQQTLALGEFSGSRTWLTAARVRAPGEVEGGNEPIGVFSGLLGATAWSPAEGTVALAIVSQQQLEVRYICEGAP